MNALKRILTGRAVRLLVAAVLGALIGLIVFSITKVTGRNLFIVTGAIAGGVTVLAQQAFARSAQLTEVKISVPQVSALTFVVNNESRQVAWRLYVETVTRVSTQPLAHDEGLLREAMTSLYGLFSTTRETLKAGRPSVRAGSGHTVEYLAVTMLNRELRPFLSNWHPRLREYEQGHPDGSESAWPESAACRRDLSQVQARVLDYALGFAQLAGVQDAESMITGPPR